MRWEILIVKFNFSENIFFLKQQNIFFFVNNQYKIESLADKTETIFLHNFEIIVLIL
jgi:hypothetical protein